MCLVEQYNISIIIHERGDSDLGDLPRGAQGSDESLRPGTLPALCVIVLLILITKVYVFEEESVDFDIVRCHHKGWVLHSLQDQSHVQGFGVIGVVSKGYCQSLSFSWHEGGDVGVEFVCQISMRILLIPWI